MGEYFYTEKEKEKAILVGLPSNRKASPTTE